MTYRDLLESDDGMPTIMLRKKTHDLLTGSGFRPFAGQDHATPTRTYSDVGARDVEFPRDQLASLGWKKRTYHDDHQDFDHPGGHELAVYQNHDEDDPDWRKRVTVRFRD